MKRIHRIVMLIALFLGVSGFSLGFTKVSPNDKASRLQLRVGERLTYRVDIKGIPVGEQVFTVKEATKYQGHPVYYITMELKNYKAISLLLKYHEKTELYLDQTTLFPRYIKKEVQERKRSTREEIRFSPEEGRIEQVIMKDRKERKKSFAMDRPCLESLSLVYYLRSRPWREGEKSLTFLTSNGPETFIFTNEGTEEVDSPYKRMSAEKIWEPNSQITVWISRRESAVPVEIQASRDFGSINSRLVEID